MRRLAALSLTLAAACSHSSGGSPAAGDDTGGDDAPATDASPMPPEPDAGDAPVDLPLYAASSATLYQLDVDQKIATRIAPVTDADGDSHSIDGLALWGHTLIAIADGGAQLLTLDKDTGKITAAMPLTPQAHWAGLTVIPAGEMGPDPIMLAGAGSSGSLYRIDPVTGATTAIGQFGGNHSFFSDLAWVHGVGLFATLTGGDCAQVCFAKIDPTTGAATTFRTNLGGNLYGLSGYRNQLWAFNSAGPVLEVNQTSGAMTLKFDPQVPWTEAAQ